MQGTLKTGSRNAEIHAKHKCIVLTQTATSEPEKPSVLRAKLSKSLSDKLLGVSPRCTCSEYRPKKLYSTKG